MGLENLKSIFAEGAGNNNSQISNRYVDISAYPRQNVEAVNFFGPENSYSSPLEKPIEGFTLNFNQGWIVIFQDLDVSDQLWWGIKVKSFRTSVVKQQLAPLAKSPSNNYMQRFWDV